MEHLLHIFGGGCGEHMALPIIGSLVVSLGILRVACRQRWNRIKAVLWRSPTPKSFVHNGEVLVDGVDYHGEHDRMLIERHGIGALNFCPSTPSRYR
jgi:hypothetical protein